MSWGLKDECFNKSKILSTDVSKTELRKWNFQDNIKNIDIDSNIPGTKLALQINQKCNLEIAWFSTDYFKKFQYVNIS